MLPFHIPVIARRNIIRPHITHGYSHGFRNPFFPSPMRVLFTMEMIDAKVGLDAEAPSTQPN